VKFHFGEGIDILKLVNNLLAKHKHRTK